MNWKIKLKNYTFWMGLIGLIGMIVVYNMMPYKAVYIWRRTA